MDSQYHILEPIGEGSYGKVYKARERCTGRVVAIKFISKQGKSRRDIGKIRKEIDILRTLDHENIILMLDDYETETDFCLVMEYAQGELSKILQDERTLPESQVQEIAKQLVRALNYLHSNRVIHRDMKPHNIVIGAHGRVKLCDFGFARAMSLNTVLLTSIKGTPLYMAPELVKEQPYDLTADLWSLGVILYELFVGLPPFYTNSLDALADSIIKDPVRYPPHMSPELRSFLQGLLRKDPRQRLSWPDLLEHPFVRETEEDRFLHRREDASTDESEEVSSGDGQFEVHDASEASTHETDTKSSGEESSVVEVGPTSFRPTGVVDSDTQWEMWAAEIFMSRANWQRTALRLGSSRRFFSALAGVLSRPNVHYEVLRYALVVAERVASAAVSLLAEADTIAAASFVVRRFSYVLLPVLELFEGVLKEDAGMGCVDGRGEGVRVLVYVLELLQVMLRMPWWGNGHDHGAQMSLVTVSDYWCTLSILTSLLEHADPAVRAKACHALDVSLTQAVGALIDGLRDPDEGVRLQATGALGNLVCGDEALSRDVARMGGVEALLDVATWDPMISLRRLALLALSTCCMYASCRDALLLLEFPEEYGGLGERNGRRLITQANPGLGRRLRDLKRASAEDKVAYDYFSKLMVRLSMPSWR